MEYRDELLRSLRDETRFARLTFSSPARPREAEWLKVSVAPMLLRGERRLRALFQGERKQVARMIAPGEVEQQLDALLGAGFQRISLQCTDGDLHVPRSRLTALVRLGLGHLLVLSLWKPARSPTPD